MLDNLLSLNTVEIIKTAGLHKIVGEIAGIGDLDMRKVAGLIGAKSFIRRKTAKLIASGILSLAAAKNEKLSSISAQRIRDTISPVKGA